MIKLKELPQTKFEVTRYSHVSGAQVYVQNIRDGDVKIVMEKAGTTKSDAGLDAPQAYIDKFSQTPKAYRFENKEDGAVYGYMLYALDFNWWPNSTKAETSSTSRESGETIPEGSQARMDKREPCQGGGVQSHRCGDGEADGIFCKGHLLANRAPRQKGI